MLGICFFAAMNLSAEREYKLLDGTIVIEGKIPSALFGDRYYAVLYPSARNVGDSSSHPMGLDWKLRSCFIACRVTSAIHGSGIKNGEPVVFVCSRDEETYRSYVQKFIDESNQKLRNMGHDLVKGIICSFHEDGRKHLVMVVARALDTEKQGDSLVLAQRVKELVRECKGGVFEIEGYVVKTTLVLSGSVVNVSDLLPPTK